jgi:N4-gp56 family major capsid protein
MPSFEYKNNAQGYSDGQGGTISYGVQYGNGGRQASTVVDPTHGYITPGSGNTTDTGSIKKQLINDYWIRESMIEAAKTQTFAKLGTQRNLAPNNGKFLKQYVWMPLLDDRNINDQGIDANGVYYANGNMYGSSKDISTISGKLPVIGENGGRYNRVGFTRNVIEGTIHELGYFFEITEDAMQFDSQSDLLQHMHREAMRGASEIVEDVMQLELINGAGIDYYCGGATTNATMDNDGTTPCELTYKDLLKLRQTLVDNKVPKTYKMFTGSQNTDTRTVAGGWTIYCQPELRTTLMTMLDLFGNPAFIPVEKYAAGGNIVENEIGRILEFRFVEVQEMLRWDNAGAAVSNNDATYISDGTNYTVFPLLIIGEDSFVNINFRGGKNNYRIYQQMPGQGAANADDPFGKHGWWSIQWWYGTMITRPDRLICIHTLAKA